MTKLGLYLAQRSVNKAEAGRKAGLTKARMNDLTQNERSHLRAKELYLIAIAIGVNPCELLEVLYNDVELPKEE
ncbi:MAG: helix-turn-helix domain-containing protein [Sphingobacteriales bacterium]|uniref:helix-turn-helix domain-containing protein n=1 Tax=uncultured Dysgonomonas sp. TaxID=206096 RepID=UPI000959DE7F|nr:helix-turn-helix transcriptional regulator [uncultured Dysgonomonas sp.]MBN8856996.1 helix-turn-helix domain-containing protein [Sphingobacteriales bacterium]OJY89306.1 MAG: DNA-binding protein [Sphingobacteriales bacterium 44-15]